MSIRVPGEDVPLLVPASMVVVGALCVTTATSVAAAPPEVPPAPPPVASQVAPEPPPPAPAAEPAEAEPAPAPAPAPCGKLVVRFATGSVAGPASARGPLARLGEFASAREDALVLVEGHADAVGDEMFNLRLSRGRAAWVAARLQEAGVPRARVTVRGLGAFSPALGLAEDDSSNRRVVVTVGGTKECAPVPEEEIR